ncbi:MULTISPECIES: hypothetical protein [unclassified Mesorhizobium]|uniref:hypothetical protein n=1 Tax=unclassified Mesorhizobium TaxID=325217 RepID=UPI000BAF5D8D|nr:MULTISPECIES: hypothetical protein [unclassified Mesorhizobium]RUW49448.1 hypothetical protein EOA32_22525 [Mesorhizobium sp. M1A.F.Ca.ET.072.01.1.1]TIU99025.1 MAG: hypothetical protein E5W04_22240 [Mesorhizobium sp.]
MTPAMAAGVSKTLWSMDDHCAKMDAVAPKPGKRGPYGKSTKGQMSIHVLKIIACANRHTQYPDGERHALLVYINAHDLGTALSSSPRFLAECGWELIEVRGSKRLEIEISSISDEPLRNAAATAVQEGYGIVVYATPIADLNS